MSAPVTIAPAQAPPGEPAPSAATGPGARPDRSWVLMLASCVALAALSLLLPGAPTYDPWSWIIWGREIGEGTLSTTTGPSWKPLPVLFTTPFALAGDAAAPQLWLLVARAGCLLGIAMAFRLAARLAGWPAGLIAAVALLASEGYVYQAYRGNSEGLLVGLALWAVERHLDGRRGWAFGLGFAAALLRPEVWPLWGLYGLWAAAGDPRLRRWAAAAFAALPVAWLLPEYLGSGRPLRAASRAMNPNLDSPAYADFPAWAALEAALGLLPLAVSVGAVAAVVAALRRRAGEHDHVVVVLAVAAIALLATVALMTQAGFSGNLRYVALPLALVGVLAGAGWVRLTRSVAARLGAAAAVVAVAAGAAAAAATADELELVIREQRAAVLRELAETEDLPLLVGRAGGPAAIRACGAVFATRYQVPSVAWELRLHLRQVGIFPLPPGTVIALHGSAASKDPRFAPLASSRRWVARQRCR